MLNIPTARFVVSLVLVSAAGIACQGTESASGRTTPATTEQPPAGWQPIGDSAIASEILYRLQGRPQSPLATGLVAGFEEVPGGLRPHFGAADRVSARVVLPDQSLAAARIEDAETGIGVDVSLEHALVVDAEPAKGYVVYPGAHVSGATVLHRPLTEGLEDFISFEKAPRVPEITYKISLRQGVAGLRLVAGTLELLDVGGAPRLRVAPPYLVGADGDRTDAELAVEGCAVDRSPAAPWGRPVTEPGADTCVVRVSWNDEAIAYPAVLDPRWTTTGSMTVARQNHTAIPLSTGKVLVAGGRSSGTSTTGLKSAELYDRTTGMWAVTGNMAGGRYMHTATQLNSSSNTTTGGKVLIAGGLNGTTSVNTAELYSPSAGTWMPAGNLNAQRHAHSATLLADGKVLVAGGLNGTATLASAAVYNPASGAGSWAPTTGQIPPPGLKAHTATLLTTASAQLKNKVLLVGGNSGSATVVSVFLFDPASSQFSTLTALPSPREGHTTTVLPNGNLLVAGGKNGTMTLPTALLFNPSSGPGTWTPIGNMTAARQLHSATALSNGQVLVAGGSSGSATLASAELFNGTNAWAATTALPAAVQAHTAVLLTNNAVLIAGGVNGTTVNTARLYDVTFGVACTTNSQCVTGFCASGVCCDTACAGSCNACNLAGKVGTCSIAPSGTVCRAAAGACDVAETCSGSSSTCPNDAVVAAGTVCRPALGACDIAETCSGSSGICPTDRFAAAGIVCAAASGNQGAETCSGGSSLCPESGKAADVLGFETAGDWVASNSAGQVVGQNGTHTQELQSMEVTAQGSATFTSAPITSIGSSGTLLLLDVMLPIENPPNPTWSGTAGMFVSAPSIGVNNDSAGQVALTGLPHGQWETIAFQLPSTDAAKLSAGGYSDLTFTISLAVPASETGHFLFDNLRVAAADVIPSLYGIATNSAGATKAIFTYTTTATTSVQIPYGQGNALLDATNAFIVSPSETPPQNFVSAAHAPFVATLTGSALTWRIGTHTATATAGSTQLPTASAGDGTKDAVLPDGRKVNLDSTPPQDPTATASAEPPVGAPDNGVLSGTLQITPSGASAYTLPIVMAPAVAGMAPNLSLSYNSQGPDGIAGQGWSLQGLSMIHKCPRTKQQDGVARPVAMDADPTLTSDNNTDGICLDGQRLFETGSGKYVPEKKDFSTITYFPSDNHFEVQTKSNEIRYYGLTTNTRVVGHGLDAQNNTTTATAIWALERVTDVWGNFFYLHYNQNSTYTQDLADFAQRGLIVTEIDYTGHMSASGVVDTPPFASVKFGYEPRPDVRSARFAQSRFPTNQRLKTITTDRGTYTLNYGGAVVSELTSIGYCTGATCLSDLTFAWTGGLAAWSQPLGAGYVLPAIIPNGHGLTGTQFIDLDGDGRTDLVYAGPDQNGSPISLAYLNTGSGWTLAPPRMFLPTQAPLANLQGVPTGTRFADMDGDGVLDLVVGPQVWLNRLAQGQTWESRPEFSAIPLRSTFETIHQIDFIGTATCDPNINGTSANDFCENHQHMRLLPASLVDINGDGRMDIVRVEESGATPQSLNAAALEILINQGPGANPAWVRSREQVLTDVTPNFNNQPALVLADLNRDGFPDLLRERYSYDGSHVFANSANRLFAFQQVALNQRDSAGVPQFAPTVSRANGDVAPLPFGPLTADLDGDGLYDEVLFAPLNLSAGLASGVGVAMNDGAGPRLGYDGDFEGYVDELNNLAPHLSPLLPETIFFAEDFAYALADINGDGLPDLIRNHYSCPSGTGCVVANAGGGEVFYNTGTTWGSRFDQFQRSAGTNALPGVVPGSFTGGCGGAFVDLNGDGVVDFLQEEGSNGTTCNGSQVSRGAWINTASPPVITGFPNGRAIVHTTVSYVHITEADAHTDGVACDGVNAKAVYCDDGPVDAGTKKLSVPMRVAWKVSKADGAGSGHQVDTTYAYHSLRADADTNGRGPLGFQRVIAYDHASGVKTETQYYQGYPYTGMPGHVVRTQVTQSTLCPTTTTTSNAPISDTTTHYCDTTILAANGIPTCAAPGTTYPAHTSLFVYPYDVLDVAALQHDSSGNDLTTDTKFLYDSFGNSKQVVVTTITSGPSTTSSTITVTTTNQYGSSGSEEEKQGKVTDVQVSAVGEPFVGATGHHTTFTYAPVSTFGGASSSARALSKKEIEPGSGWPVQEDTVFLYDQFGNVIVTTSCANDFASCTPSGASPSPVAADHPPFRTTMVSFTTGSFNTPAGPGLISSLGYGNGRFPVKTSTTTFKADGGSVEHVEFSAYDPVKGVLLQKTGPNGIHTCFTYDDLGRPTSEIVRCGSNSPIVRTTAYLKPAIVVNGGIGTPAPGTPLNTQLITVARSSSGAATWVFTDDQDKPIEQLARSFGGGFIETLTTYNALGQVTTATKPIPIQNFTDTPATTYHTATIYDGFNRVCQVTEDLGGIGATGGSQLVTTTTYDGLSGTTTRMVDGAPQTRTETKNALGKVQSVVDSLGGEIDYVYDPDGNLVAAQTPGSQNLVFTTYDARGRKTQMTDVDMGTWNYLFDGFGDLISQTDANNQQFAMTYDQLGRMMTKQNLATSATAQWIYDTAGGAGIGKLAAMVSEADANFKGPCGLPTGATVSGGNRSVTTYAYTGFGDLQAVAECADGDTFQTSYEYDSIGRQSLIHYPAVNTKQLTVGYHYTGLGYLQHLSDESSDYGILWQAKAMDAFGHVTDEQARNGVETVQTRSPGNGWLVGSTSTAHSDGNTVVQGWTYTFDEVGDLLSRGREDQVADAPSAETFVYDALNRVTGASMTVGAPVNASSSSSYDYQGNGNLWHKDGKTYTYDGTCGPIGRSGTGLHQVCSIDGGPRFVYDAAGNLTANGDRTVVYNAHNKAAQVTSAAGTVKFMYGADDNRVVQLATSGATTSRTVYVGLGATGKSMYERTTTGTTIQHTNFIYAGGAHGGNAFAVRLVANDGTTTANRYLSFDHLGSTTAVSDERGHIAAATGPDTELLGYDPWGARREPDGAPPVPSTTYPSSVGHRDFTGQETIPSVGLINMNGRVYDPVLARFLSPDPVIQAPDDLQNYNRYSYVHNNPLRYTDPTGYDFWDSAGRYFSNPTNVFEFVASIAVCALGTPVMCMVLGATFALMNATSALLQGASFQQTALNVAIGVGVGMLGSGAVNAALGPGASPIWGMIAGSASAAATTAISDRIAGRSLGWDVFWSAAISAAQGAATLGLQQVAPLSQASAGVDDDEVGEFKRKTDRSSVVQRVAALRDAAFPDYKWVSIEDSPSHEGPLASDVDFLHQGSINSVNAIWAGSDTVTLSDEQLTVSIEHELRGHIAAIVAGNHPYDPSTGDWNGGATTEELLFHAKVNIGDATYAALHGWFDEALFRVQRASVFYDTYQTSLTTPMPDLSH